MSNAYDVIVFGSGVAGGVAARSLKTSGKSVAVIDPGPLGGTCPLRGCEPKKVMYDAVETLVRTRNQDGNGLFGDEPDLDWQQLVRFKNTFVHPVPGHVEKDFHSRGIDLFKSKGRFLDQDTVDVDGRRLTADAFIIATGAMARPLDFPGAEYLLSNDQFFDLQALPWTMLIIGGGYIAFEFAHLAARLGVEVELVVRSDRCLKYFDPDLVDLLVDHSKQYGIHIAFQAPPQRVEKTDRGLRLMTGEGRVHREVDLILHGAGRIPNLEGLNLEAAGIKETGKGLEVDPYLRSRDNPKIFGAGDVVPQGPQLTPVALMEAELLANNLAGNDDQEVDYSGIPSVLFTHPMLARTGFLEAECREQGLDFEKRFVDASKWASYQRIGEKPAAVKLLWEKQTGRILGAHMLGHGADEVINIFSLAIQKAIARKDLIDVVWSYPSFGYDVIRHVLV